VSQLEGRGLEAAGWWPAEMVRAARHALDPSTQAQFFAVIDLTLKSSCHRFLHAFVVCLLIEEAL